MDCKYVYEAEELYGDSVEQMFLLHYLRLRTETAYKIINAEKGNKQRQQIGMENHDRIQTDRR